MDFPIALKNIRSRDRRLRRPAPQQKIEETYVYFKHEEAAQSCLCGKLRELKARSLSVLSHNQSFDVKRDDSILR